MLEAKKSARSPKATLKKKVGKLRVNEVDRVVQAYLKTSNYQFYEIDLVEYDQFVANNQPLRKPKSKGLHYKTEAPHERRQARSKVAFMQPILPPKEALRATIDDDLIEIHKQQKQKKRDLKKQGVVVADNEPEPIITESVIRRPVNIRKTIEPKDHNNHHMLQPILSLPPIKKDKQPAWLRVPITRNVQEAWGRNKRASPRSVDVRKTYEQVAEDQEKRSMKKNCSDFEHPYSFRNIKHLPQKSVHSLNSELKNQSRAELKTPQIASLQQSIIEGKMPSTATNSMKQSYSRDHLAPMDTQSKYEMRSTSTEFRGQAITPLGCSQNRLKATTRLSQFKTFNKKYSLQSTASQFSVYEPQPPKLYMTQDLSKFKKGGSKKKSTIVHTSILEDEGMKVQVQVKKSPRAKSSSRIPKVGHLHPILQAIKQPGPKESLIKIYALHEHQLLIIHCVRNDLVVDKDKFEYSEFEDLLGRGVDFEDREALRVELRSFVDDCLKIQRGKIVIRAPEAAPAQIQISDPTEGPDRIDMIIEEMKASNTKVYKKFMKSLTNFQKKFKRTSAQQISELKKQNKRERAPLLTKGVIKLGERYFRYTIRSIEGELLGELEYEFYDLEAKSYDQKVVRVFDALELLDKQKIGPALPLAKIGKDLLMRVKACARFMEYGKVSELIESCFEVDTAERMKRT